MLENKEKDEKCFSSNNKYKILFNAFFISHTFIPHRIRVLTLKIFI